MQNNAASKNEIIVRIPTLSGNPLPVRHQKIAELQARYSLVNIIEEMSDFAFFLKENPKYQRKRSGTPAFYHAWLKLIHNRNRQKSLPICQFI